MKSVPSGKSTRHAYRSTPALSTPEAAALVLGVIEARLHDGWQLDQIGWQSYCRDSAVIQVVTQQLNQAHGILREASSWTAPL
jgi:hypothetical protein